MMKQTLSRRIFLRGLGGACVAAPFLPSIEERVAKAQATPPVAPKRLIVFFTFHGCLTNRWFPARAHGTLSSGDYQALPTLAPLAPFASKLLMPRGIRAMNEWSVWGARGQKNDPHNNAAGSMFTAHPLTPNATTSAANNPATFGKPTGRSLDHIAAASVNPRSIAPLFMQIGGVQGSVSNTRNVISWSDSGTIFPGLGSPTPIFNGLTNLFGSSVNADTYEVTRGKSVIDTVRNDLDALSRTDMSADDRRNLTDWIELLHYTAETISVGAQCSQATATQLGLPRSGTDITTLARTFMDLAVLTSICDANRVIFMKMPANASLPLQYQAGNGTTQSLTLDAHTVSHRVGSSNQGGQCVPDAIGMIHAIDKYYAALFAYLVGMLDVFSEGGARLLDNTATVWIQEMSDGNSHNLNNLPILQAGSCAGYFKTGRAINVEGAKVDMSSGHSDEDCVNGQSPLESLDTVGTPANVATMPINKYFCNLLNAIGAKADASGYATPGGAAPVTKFGKYDDTRLFSDGGTAPATISNPGEYTELRA